MVENDSLNVIHPRAAGLDIHKVQITATVRVARAGKDADVWTRQFSAFPTGIGELVEWLKEHRVSAALMEGTGIYWEAPFEALEEAGITPILVHAQHVKQIKGRKTDIADSIWLARICSFGLCSPSMVPPRAFRSLRKVSRMRRQVVRERARARNRIHKILDASGVRVSGILSDLFGANGIRILRGLVENVPRETILASLTSHVRRHVNQLCDVLTAELDDCSIFLLRDQLEAFDDATRRLERYDEVINDGLAEHHDQINLMMTIPGINRASACAILIEIGPDITVFSSRRQIAAWAGLCPGNNESAGKRRSGRTRRGNTTLREVLIECAQGRRTDPELPVPRLPQGPDRPQRLLQSHRRYRTQDAARHLQRVEERGALPRPRDRLRGGHGPAQRSTLDHDAEETRHRSHDLVRPNPNRCLRHVPGSDTRRRPEKDINTIVRTKIGAGPYSGVAQAARLRQRHGAPHWTPCPGSPAFSFARTVEMLHSKQSEPTLTGQSISALPLFIYLVVASSITESGRARLIDRIRLVVSVRSAGDDFCQSLSLRFQSLRSGCTQMSFLARAHSFFLS